MSGSGFVSRTFAPLSPSPRYRPNQYGSSGNAAPSNSTGLTHGTQWLGRGSLTLLYRSVSLISLSGRTDPARRCLRSCTVVVNHKCSSQHSVDDPSENVTRYTSFSPCGNTCVTLCVLPSPPI